MDTSESDFINQNGKRLREYENTPREFVDPYSDMTGEEKSKLILLLQDMIRQREDEAKRKDEENARLGSRLDEVLHKLDESNSRIISLTQLLAQIQKDSSEKDKLIASLLSENSNLKEGVAKGRKERFGRKSQKSDQTQQTKSRAEDKDGFDGSQGSSDYEATQEPGQPQSESKRPRTPAQLTADILRRGKKKRKSGASDTILHKADLSKLPSGAEFMGIEERYAYDREVKITEHIIQYVKYKLGAKIYLEPLTDDIETPVLDKVRGTHASSSLMAHLAISRYYLGLPLFREFKRLNEEGLFLKSRKTLTNWLRNGSKLLKPVVDLLMEKQLHDEAIINCDETWTRVKVFDKYKKRYIWCLVNKDARIVTFHYEDGSRGRDAFKNIIEGKKLKAVQTDGYNVYHYLDGTTIEHLCCLAHARAKIKEAADTGDPDARYILHLINQLYVLEAKYIEEQLTREEIGRARRYPSTMEIIGQIRSKLNVLMATGHPPRGDLMEKAVNYLNNFWRQLFKYTEDGAYSIDNNIAERQIRPLAVERKNTLFLGSHSMAKVAAIYHTVISTCKMMGYSAIEYLEKFFQKIVNNEDDYNKLLPDTIGISVVNS